MGQFKVGKLLLMPVSPSRWTQGKAEMRVGWVFSRGELIHGK